MITFYTAVEVYGRDISRTIILYSINSFNELYTYFGIGSINPIQIITAQK